MGGSNWLAALGVGRMPGAEQARFSLYNQCFVKCFSGAGEPGINCGEFVEIHSRSPTKNVIDGPILTPGSMEENWGLP